MGLKKVVVPGRAEVVNINKDYTVIIDYAHSPDSLENILTTIKEYAKGRVVCVFGCGGDRDRSKRADMGRISGELADFTIITSDNPRTEDPEKIIEDIEKGIKDTKSEYIKIVDRREAIEYALLNAKAEDVILLAGKGHETYIILKDKTIHFDEREVVKEILKE
jgi:UDP-N-acetylmuramoyl-L-alanyl-D-glutamate--2,6-diaminopimelate ligase